MAVVKQQDNDEWRSKRSAEQIALGGLPLNAEWRLRRLREGRAWSSGFSVNELALVTSLAVQPLGQVTGTSVYHVGWLPAPPAESMELRALSQAHNEARRRALLRLQAEAHALGARGVIGVRLTAKPTLGGEALLEVTVTGTAVGWPGPDPPLLPFLCGLSGQETCALYAGGYFPVGVVFGTCVYYQVGMNATLWATQNGLLSRNARFNQELPDYTDGFAQARHGAVRSMEGEAYEVQAGGVVGVTISKKLQTREVEVETGERKLPRRDLLVEFSILGTGIKAIAETTAPIHAVVPLAGCP